MAYQDFVKINLAPSLAAQGLAGLPFHSIMEIVLIFIFWGIRTEYRYSSNAFTSFENVLLLCNLSVHTNT